MMMNSGLMKSVSGIRGVIGETLTPELTVKVATAFADYTKSGTVVVGRDSRCTGEAIAGILESTLVLCGCNVIDLGIVPTPTVQIMVEEMKADGGIIISASHNSIEWNAFKLVNRDGTFLNSTQIRKFFEMMDDQPEYKKWDRIGKITRIEDAFSVHIAKVINVVNTVRIRKKRFKVAVDSVNGAGSFITLDLLKNFNCDVVPVHCSITGNFPRGAEPIAENLKELSRVVIDSGADVGFAQDPDADRLAIVDEKGKPIGEEYTVALVTEHLLSKKKGLVVVNMSTTKAVEDIAFKYDVPFCRSKVGESNVVEEMKRKSARIGGEGNGGVISPEIHMGRDSLAGIGYVLEMMVERSKTVTELVDSLPKYSMIKGKVSFKIEMLDEIYSRLKNDFSKEKMSDIDGIRIDFTTDEGFKGGWVHLRPSNTEPIFRIIAEGVDSAQAKRIYDHFENYLR
jgi:phosphomannomutase